MANSQSVQLVNCFTRRTYTDPSGTFTYAPTSRQVRKAHRERSWTRTPGYRALARAGLLPDNPFYFEESFVPVTKSSISIADDWGWYTSVDRFEHDYHLNAPLPVHDDSLIGIAARRALNQARGATFNAPVLIAELNKTSTMVASAATAITQFFVSLRRGDLHSAGLAVGLHFTRGQTLDFRRAYSVNPKKAAAGAFLQYKYGWMPFMLDVKNAVETFGEIAEGNHNAELRFRGSASAASTEVIDDLTLVSLDGGNVRVYGSMTVQKKHSCRVTWRARPNHLDIPAKLGLVNPALVAWELVPYSFVADWFLPIGSYLEAFGTEMRYTTVSVVIGQRSETIADCNRTRHTPVRAVAEGFNAFGARQLKISRTPSQGGLPWSVSMKFPTSMDKAVAAVSLLAQRLR